MKLTKHAKQRAQQRGIKPSIVSLILEYGTPVKRPGHATEYRLTTKDAAALAQASREEARRFERAKNKAVLVANDDQSVITAYPIH